MLAAYKSVSIIVDHNETSASITFMGTSCTGLTNTR